MMKMIISIKQPSNANMPYQSLSATAPDLGKILGMTEKSLICSPHCLRMLCEMWDCKYEF